MSLLMDALRKAEQQKQQSATSVSDATGAAGSSLGLEPLPEPGTSSKSTSETAARLEEINRRLPELPRRLEELDDQFFTADPALKRSIRALTDTKIRETGPNLPPLNGNSGPAREAAQNVFAAKQPAQTIGHGFAITVSIATLIAIAAIGGYFYWQMQPKGGLVAGPAMSLDQAPAPVQPASAPADHALPTISAIDQPTVKDTARPAAAVAATRKEADTTTLRSPAAIPPQPRLTEHPDTVIRLNAQSRKPDDSMETAHAAFSRGETELARAIWMKTLQADARNINALHGLSAIALQEGKPAQAAVLYRRVLETDPKDAVAHAGLLSISAPADARQAESRLKGLLVEQPNSPHLHFALGNLYLNDARWSEAQQAFFKAHVADPANPDYLYNLAVSLDHLHQNNLAAQHYARALVAAQSQAAAFDPAQVEERLRSLRNEHQR